MANDDFKGIIEKVERAEKRSKMTTVLFTLVPLALAVLFLLFSKKSMEDISANEKMQDELFVDMNDKVTFVNDGVEKIKALQANYQQESDAAKLAEIRQEISETQRELEPHIAAIENFEFSSPQKNEVKDNIVLGYSKLLSNIDEKQQLSSRLKMTSMDQSDVVAQFEKLETQYTDLYKEKESILSRYQSLLSGVNADQSTLQKKYNEIFKANERLTRQKKDLKSQLEIVKKENLELKANSPDAWKLKYERLNKAYLQLQQSQGNNREFNQLEKNYQDLQERYGALNRNFKSLEIENKRISSSRPARPCVFDKKKAEGLLAAIKNDLKKITRFSLKPNDQKSARTLLNNINKNLLALEKELGI